ncbi:MAG TPA: tartrate-resistant acid phosphatase type 5 family protein [Caulobacteraceae bacterium]|nr:tartrate-resistant acid phosphatase type 5 family protein [Caulobacteraceae bacterium]
MASNLITRRRALQGLGLAMVAPFSPAWAADVDPDPVVSFLAVGDWGRDGAFHQAEVAARMGETAKALDASCVISVGDNFYEDGVESVHDPKWKTSFEDVYTAPSLQVPWYVALGNHDYHGNTQAQLDYANTSKRWSMPGRWSHNYEGVQTNKGVVGVDLFILDTSPFIKAYYADGAKKVKVAGQDTAAQLRWLEAELAASTGDWKVVVGHHPVYSGGAGPDDPGGSPELIAQLDPILQRHRVPLYLNGHEHDLQHVARGATHYVCTGAGSQTRDHCHTDGSDFCSVESGFTAIVATPKTLRVGYRDWKGEELHVVDIARPA